MEKADAIRKVKSLDALADDASGTSEHERSAAKAKAASLCEQYAITDDDLTLNEEVIFFGSDLFFWSREVEPLLEKAGDAIRAAMDKIDRAAMPNDRINGYVKLHQTLKNACEETGFPQSRHLRLKLKTKRNALVQERYEQEFHEWLTHYTEDYDAVDEDSRQWYLDRAHDQAVTYTSFGIDLEQRQVRSIVKRIKP